MRGTLVSNLSFTLNYSLDSDDKYYMGLVRGVSKLLLGAFFISGCTAPNAEVASLGRQIPTPSMKSENISRVSNTSFGQGTTDQAYLQFTGACNATTSNLKFALQKSDGTKTSFQSIPDTTSYIVHHPGTIDSNEVYTNDLYCGDGTFDFVLSLQQVNDLGITAADLKYIYLIAESHLWGSSQPLVLSTRAGANSNGLKIGVSQISLPYLGENLCESFWVSLENSQGEKTVTGADTNFSLAINNNDGITPNAPFSLSLTDCAANTTVTASKINANNNAVEIFLRPGNANAYLDANKLKIRADSGTALSKDYYVAYVRGMPNFSQVDIGAVNSCGVTFDNRVLCWGSNADGQLGANNRSGAVVSPAYVKTSDGLDLADVKQVSTSYNHSCAVTNAGSLYCWGDNTDGVTHVIYKVGPSASLSSYRNALLVGSGFTQVSTGANHTCAITSGKGLKCWGDNSMFQLANSNTTTRSWTVYADGSGIAQVAVGADHTCIITDAFLMRCWGRNNKGQLGLGSSVTGDQYTPQEVTFAGISLNIKSMSLGYLHTCAIAKSNGKLYCWGDNSALQLAQTSTTQYSTPQVVSSLSSNTDVVAAGAYHTCAIKSGTVYCWGQNTSSQVTTTASTTEDVHARYDIVGAYDIALGLAHTCVLTSTVEGVSSVQCWGNNDHGQLGTNPYRKVSISGLPAKILKGGCYEFAVGANNYNNPNDLDNSETVQVTFPAATSTGLNLYTNSSCSLPLVVTQNLLGDLGPLYAKYTDSTNDTSPVDVTLNVISNTYLLDSITQHISIDRTGVTSFAALAIQMDHQVKTNTIPGGVCIPITISSVTANGTPMMSSQTTDLAVTLSQGSGNGNFYTTKDCSGGTPASTTTASILKKTSSTTVYYWTSSSAQNFTMTFTAGSISATSILNVIL